MIPTAGMMDLVMKGVSVSRIIWSQTSRPGQSVWLASVRSPKHLSAAKGNNHITGASPSASVFRSF